MFWVVLIGEAGLRVGSYYNMQMKAHTKALLQPQASTEEIVCGKITTIRSSNFAVHRRSTKKKQGLTSSDFQTANYPVIF